MVSAAGLLAALHQVDADGGGLVFRAVKKRALVMLVLS